MNPAVRFYKLLYVLILLSATSQTAVAQQIKVFPLIQHKLLWADTVYREGIKKKDSLLLAEAYYLYGKTYEGAGDLLTSHRWFMKSLAILEPRGDSYQLSRLYSRLSTQELRMGNYRQNRKYAHLALDVARRIGDHRALSTSFGTMADTYRMDWSRGGKKPDLPVPKPDSVAHYMGLQGKVMMLNMHKDSLVKVDLLVREGYKRWEKTKDTSSFAYFRKALGIAKQKNENSMQFYIRLDLARLYMDTRNYQQAWNMLRATEQFLQNSPFKNGYPAWYELEIAYRNYYADVKDWRNAYEHAEKLYEMERNNYITDRDGAVTRLNLEYETEKKEAQLKAQQRELALNADNLTSQRYFLLVLGVLLFLVIATGFAFYRLYRKNQRISLRNGELVREQNHRVKNNLQVVSSLLSMQSNRLVDEQARQAVEDSQSRVETMAILHRHLYDGDGLITVHMSDFIPQIVRGVLQTYGFDQSRTHLDIGPVSLSANQALPLGLIVNELATNACKYAFTAADADINIRCRRDGNKVFLHVSDNGPGIDLDFLDHQSGKSSFGLRLIRIQVEQLYGTYEFRNEGGTSFQMQFTADQTSKFL